jgi:hypothetical protein
MVSHLLTIGGDFMLLLKDAERKRWEARGLD